MDHDLRHDQEAADERTHYNLRTVSVRFLSLGSLAREIDELRAEVRAMDERTRYNLPAVKPAQAFAALRQTFGAAADAIDDPNGRYSTPACIDTGNLRTVPMPNLRSPTARDLDAAARDLDCRTYSERVDARLKRIEAALERIADAVTVLMLERETKGEN